MKEKKKITVIFSILVLLLLVIIIIINSTKNSVKDDGIKYLIGVSQPNLIESWQVAMNEEVKAEANKSRDVKVIFTDAGKDNDKQKKDIEGLIEQKVDLLIVSANDTHYLTNEISKAYKNGIPIVMMGYPIESYDYSMLIYTDNTAIGKAAGKAVSDALGKRGGVVLEIQGDPSSPVTRERKIGFREGIKENPNIKIEYVIVGFWSRDIAERNVREINNKKPKVNIVFSHNDSMAYGAWKAMGDKSTGIKFISIDGLKEKNEGLFNIKTGILDTTFMYPTGGKEAIVNALKILRGEYILKKYEISAVKVTKENVDEYLKK